MKIVVLSAAASLLLSGCQMAMLLTPENSTQSTVQSSSGSERTFRNVLAAMKECYPSGFTIESNYFPEARDGELNLASLSSTSRVDFAKFLVAGSGTTSRVTMHRRSNFPAFDAALPAWIEGNDGGCPYGTRSDPRPPGSETSQQNYPSK